MLAGVTIVDPATTWIEAGVELERRRGRPSVHGAARARRRVAAGAEVGPHAVAVDAAVGEGAIGRAVLLPSPWHRSRGGGEGGHVRGDQEVAHRRPDEGAAPLLHRRRRDRRGHEHRSRERDREPLARARDGRRGRPRSARTSGPVSTIRSLLRSRLATMLGFGRERSSRTMSRPDRSPASRRGRSPRKDGSTSVESQENMATTE